MPRYGAIEAGGTKFVCAVGAADRIEDEIRFETTTPDETLGRCVEYFRSRGALDALGVGCFGPLELRAGSPHYGFVTATPKPGWSHKEVAGRLARELAIPVGFDTDVNAAVLGESRFGAAQGVASAVYLTIGTGIGGGALIGGELVHGLVHPEMGHLLLPREPDDDFSGSCPFHGSRCWEGLASGPAIERRWGERAEALPPDHPAWDLEARYLASGLATLTLVLSPERVVLGGGVMNSPGLLPLVRQYLQQALGGYVQSPSLAEDIDRYVVAPGLGARSGIIGALALAERADSRER